MKILVFSDSHGNSHAINQIINKHNDYDYVFFLGDGLADISTLLYDERVFAVRGNCDFFSNQDIDKILEMQGFKILLTHGHMYSVKSNLNKIAKKAKDEECDLAFFGHTHVPYDDTIDGVRLINPGSLQKTRSNFQRYGILTIKNQNIFYENQVF